MATATFMSNPQYVAFVSLLRRLHFLMAEGKGDTDEADVVRDEMDGPWTGMSTEEQERTRRLSADLYTLDETPPIPAPQDEAAARALGAEIDLSWKAGDWEDILDLLRRKPGVLPPHSEAFLRGWSWNQLGDPETADLFFQRAAELVPRDTDPPIAVVVARSRAGNTEEADRYARAILAPTV